MVAMGIDGLLDRTAIEFGVWRRRESRREEEREQTRLVGLLARHLDSGCTFWTSLENKPRSAISGMLGKRHGVRSGLPDVLVMYRHAGGLVVIFIELKSRRGVASDVQKQLRRRCFRPVLCGGWRAVRRRR
jgi:hypothetical protein